MAGEYDIVTPVKAIFQGNGEVLLAEFINTDYVSVSDGGTGAITKEGARTNLELIKYVEFDTYLELQSEVPTEACLAKLLSTGEFYYWHDGQWLTIGGSIKVSGFNNLGEGTSEDNVKKLTFNEEFTINDSDDGTMGIVLDLSPIRNRLDIIEGDETVPGSILNAIYNLVDLAPETLNTLNELANAIGNDPDFLNTINTRLQELQTAIDNEIIDRQTAITNLEDFFTQELATEKQERIAGDDDTYAIITAETNQKLSTETLARQTEIATIEEALNSFITLQNSANDNFELRLDIIEGDETIEGSIKYAIKMVVGDAVAELDTLQEIAEALSNNPDIINLINTQLENLSVGDLLNVQINQPISDGDVLSYDEVSGTFQNSPQSNGSFLKFIESDGEVDGVPVVRTTRGDTVLESYIDFYQADGTQQKLFML